MAKITVGGSGRIHSGGKISQEIQDFNRANHNLSKIVRDTIAPGVCVPIYTKRTLPGDTFDIEDIEMQIYTDPTERAMYGAYKMYIEFYFAPTRLYQAWLHNNKEYIGEDMSRAKLPLMDIVANGIDWNLTEQAEIQQVHPSSLLAHLGLRSLGQHVDGYTKDSPNVRGIFNAETMLAYYDIGKNYYANRQEKVLKYIDYTGQAMTNLRIVIKGIYSNGNETDYKTTEIKPDNQTLDPNWIYMQDSVTDKELTLVKAQLQFIADKLTIGNNDGEWRYILSNGPNEVQTIYKKDDLTIFREDGKEIAVINIHNHAGQLQKLMDYPMILSVDGITGTSEQQPVVADAPITNLDDMREDILASIKSENAFVINKDTYAPYGSNFKNQTKTVYLENDPTKPITRDCITSYYPMQGLYLCTYLSDKFNNFLDTEYVDKMTGVGGKGLLDVTEGLNLNVLQLAMKIYNQTNKIAISNRSYEDWMLVVHGQHGAAKTEIPRYEGGVSQDIYFQELRSTAATENQPAGSFVSNARVAGDKKGGKIVIRCEEAGHIIGICRIVPKLIYSQGNNPDLDLKTMDDLHQPDLDGIGYQDLLTERFAALDTRRDDNGVPTYRSIGKQPAYIDYMTDIDEAYGDFAIENNKMTMTLNRRYQYKNGFLEDGTTYIDPAKFNYVWAGVGRNTMHFDTQIGMRITARRKVSTRQMPQFSM